MFCKLKNRTSIISFKTIAAVLASVVFVLAAMVIITIFADSTASARVTQTQINQLREEKREYERRKSEVQAKIDAIEFQHLTEMQKKEVLDQRIMLTDFEIKNINKTIEQFYQLIREKEYEVYLAQNREETQLQRYRSRVRDMEENGIISYLEILFDATSFSDLLARIDFVADIMRSDRTLYNNLQIIRSENEEAKAGLEEAKNELEGEKEQLEIKETELMQQLDEAHAIILKLEDDMETESILRDELTAEEDRIQAEINTAVEQFRRQQELDRQRREAERRRQEAERQRRLQEQNQSQQNSGSTDGSNNTNSNTNTNANTSSSDTTVTGKFLFPVPSGRIISRFGVARGTRTHQGLDIGAAHGADIVAAESGTVVVVSYGSGYGHYVTIDHGGGIQTLYSHLSSTAVTVGTYVTRGQVVGYNGSSGNATTPHLHFEVFVNKVRVNPERFL